MVPDDEELDPHEDTDFDDLLDDDSDFLDDIDDEDDLDSDLSEFDDDDPHLEEEAEDPIEEETPEPVSQDESEEPQQDEPEELPNEEQETTPEEESDNLEELPPRFHTEAVEEDPTPFTDLPIMMTVELSRVQLNVKQVIEMRPGSTLELPEPKQNSVDLVVEGKKVGQGELIKVGETIGVRILQMGKNAL